MPICDSCGTRTDERNGRFFTRETGSISAAYNVGLSWSKKTPSKKRISRSGGRTIKKEVFICFHCRPLPTERELELDRISDWQATNLGWIIFAICATVWALFDPSILSGGWLFLWIPMFIVWLFHLFSKPKTIEPSVEDHPKTVDYTPKLQYNSPIDIYEQMKLIYEYDKERHDSVALMNMADKDYTSLVRERQDIFLVAKNDADIARRWKELKEKYNLGDI